MLFHVWTEFGVCSLGLLLSLNILLASLVAQPKHRLIIAVFISMFLADIQLGELVSFSYIIIPLFRKIDIFEAQMRHRGRKLLPYSLCSTPTHTHRGLRSLKSQVLHVSRVGFFFNNPSSPDEFVNENEVLRPQKNSERANNRHKSPLPRSQHLELFAAHLDAEVSDASLTCTSAVVQACCVTL